MGDFIRKWHPLLLIVIAIYLAIPKPAPEPGDRFQWPLNAYKWNLGQDLSGGSSLRFKLVQQDLKDAEQSLRDLLKPLAAKAELPAPVREKFGTLIKGGPLKQDAYTLRAKSDESDDFDLLKRPGSLTKVRPMPRASTSRPGTRRASASQKRRSPGRRSRRSIADWALQASRN